MARTAYSNASEEVTTLAAYSNAGEGATRTAYDSSSESAALGGEGDILLESGFTLLLESGDALLLEGGGNVQTRDTYSSASETD